MSKREVNFCIIGKVDDTQTFNEIVDLLHNLPNIEPRYTRTSESWFYVTQDRQAATRAGLLRKNRRGPE